METLRNRFSSSSTILFAAAALGLGVAAAFATKSMSPKIFTAVYGAIVGAAGFGAAFATKARLRTVVLTFLGLAAVVAVTYYLLVSHVFSSAITTMTDVASGGDATAAANGKKAASFMSKYFGIFAAVIGFLETFIVGTAGAIAGSKFKKQSLEQPSPHVVRAA